MKGNGRNQPMKMKISQMREIEERKDKKENTKLQTDKRLQFKGSWDSFLYHQKYHIMNRHTNTGTQKCKMFSTF